MLQPDPQSFGTDEVLGYGYAEHLLVWAWRRMASGRGRCPVLTREFAEAFGEEAAEVLASLAAFLHILGHGSRRRLMVGPPCSLAFTPDERQVLDLLAAAQNHHPAAFEAHLAWLIRGEFASALSIGARALATAFAMHGLALPMPAALCPIPLRQQLAQPPD